MMAILWNPLKKITDNKKYLDDVWNPRKKLENNKIYLDDLEISFHRVPDNHKSSALPPSLGKFPLYQVEKYATTLPHTMAAKGGLFLPMYRE